MVNGHGKGVRVRGVSAPGMGGNGVMQGWLEAGCGLLHAHVPCCQRGGCA
jgi:hypothetical protein